MSGRHPAAPQSGASHGGSRHQGQDHHHRGRREEPGRADRPRPGATGRARRGDPLQQSGDQGGRRRHRGGGEAAGRPGGGVAGRPEFGRRHGKVVRRRGGCRRPARHRDQHGGQGAEEALHRNHRGRVRRDDGGQLEGRVLLPARSGPPRQRQRQDLHAGHFAAGRLHAVLRGLCRHQGPGRALHPRRIQGIRHPRHLGDGGRPRPDGHALLLSGRRRRRGGLPQGRRRAVAVFQDRPDRHRGRGALHPLPGVGRLVDHRPDHPDQRRLHHK